MNKKMRRSAFKAILSILAKNNQVKVSSFKKSDEPRAVRKQLLEQLKDFSSAKLVVLNRKEAALAKASNIQNAEVISLNRFGAKQMAGKGVVIFEEEALNELEKRFKS